MKTSPIIALDFDSAEKTFDFLRAFDRRRQCQSGHATLL